MPSQRVNRALLRELYVVRKLGVKRIVKITGIPQTVVYENLLGMGVVRTRAEAQVIASAERAALMTRENVKRLYEVDGLTTVEVARKLHVNRKTLRSFMERNGIKRRRASYSARAESRYEILIDDGKVIDDYKNKRLTVVALSRKYGMSAGWISKCLKRHGVVVIHRNRYNVGCSKAA